MIIIIITDNIHNTVIIMKVIDLVFYILILPFFVFIFLSQGRMPANGYLIYFYHKMKRQ